MSGLFRSRTSATPTRYAGLNIQTSALGIVMPLGWGTFRTKFNVVWYNNFQSQAVKAGGKGGSQTTGYTYTADLIMGVCEGPINAILTVYKDSSVLSSPSAAGLSYATGAIGQSVWGYLATNYPAQAIGYSGLVIAYASNYALDDSAAVPNHSAEIQSLTTVSGLPDANPKDILTDWLTNTRYGVPNWPSGALGDWTSYEQYCLAANLLLSPVIDEERTGSDFLQEILQASNSDCVWSEGLLKIVPYGDTTVTGNGQTWSPNLTPVYALDDDSYIVDKEGDDPITAEIKDQSDAYNIVQIDYLSRSDQYNSGLQVAQDASNIAQYGRRKQDPVSLHSICDDGVAANVAQLVLQRTLYIRGQYKFSLAWNYALLEPMVDCVTITDTDIGLENYLVRIVQIDEADDGGFDVTAEDVLAGVSHAPLYSHQDFGGTIFDKNVDPGSVSAPLFFNPPGGLTNGDLEVWVAVEGSNPNYGGCDVWASADGVNYSFVGTTTGGSRYGVTTANLPSHADPDTADTLSVNLTASDGELNSVSKAEADAFTTLCLVGSELIAYETATLTSTNNYNLTYLRRGLYGTTIGAQASSSEFVRLDATIFKYPFTKDRIGQTVYLKFLSFNAYGLHKQSLAAATAYTWTLGASVPTPVSGSWAVTGSSFIGQGQLPAIIFAGACTDTLNVSAVIFDYRERLTVGPPATFGPWTSDSFPVTTVEGALTGVIDNAWYDVQVRYRSIQNVENFSAALDLGLVQVGTIEIADQGLLATLDAIEDAQLAAGVGVNCMVDTAFSQNYNYWRASGDSTVTSSAPTTANGIKYLEVVNVGASVGQQIRLSSDNQVNSLPITPGALIECQALIGGVGLSSIVLQARWLDATGANIGGIPQTSAAGSASSYGAGAGEADSYTQLGATALVAPAGAYRVELQAEGIISSSPAKLRMIHPMIAKAKSGSVQLTQYNPGLLAEPGATVGATTGVNLTSSTYGTLPDSGSTGIVTGINTATAISGQQAWATAKVTVGSSAPGSPNTGDIWFDTSSSPTVMKRYNGSSWVAVTASASDITALIGTPISGSIGSPGYIDIPCGANTLTLQWGETLVTMSGTTFAFAITWPTNFGSGEIEPMLSVNVDSSGGTGGAHNNLTAIVYSAAANQATCRVNSNGVTLSGTASVSWLAIGWT